MESKQAIENGQTVTIWYKVVSGVTESNIDAELAKALQQIQVNTGLNQNSNANNLNKIPELDISISLTNYATGASGSASGSSDVTILPATDKAEISISAGETIEDSQAIIPIAITVSNAADQSGDWKIVDGKMYFTVASDVSGTLTYSNGQVVKSLTAAELKQLGIDLGLTDGQLVYVVEGVEPNTAINLQYQLDGQSHGVKGNFELNAWVQNQENALSSNGSTQVVISDGQGQLVIKPVNNIPVLEVIAQGNEQDGTGRLASGSIQLNFAKFENMPHQTGEVLYSAVLQNIPAGFIIYYGEDEASAKMAVNAGEGVWSLPITANELPKYISIKPPANWSGTLDDIKLTVSTGETTLKPTTSEYEFDLVVKPVADGIQDFVPTYSFNEKGSISTVLNLNIGMRDPSAATNSTAKDQHTEVTDLILKGFTDPAAIFIANGVEISADRITLIQDNNGVYQYTITGLTQTELDQLEIVHKNTNGQLIIKAEAYTYEVDLNGNKVSENSATKDADFKFQVSGVAETATASLMLLDDDQDTTNTSQTHFASDTDGILQGHTGQDYFIWDTVPDEDMVTRVQDFNPDEDQLDVSRLLDQLGWDGERPLSDFMSYTQNGEDAELVIGKDSNSVTIIVENNDWSNIEGLMKSDDFKADN